MGNGGISAPKIRDTIQTPSNIVATARKPPETSRPPRKILGHVSVIDKNIICGLEKSVRTYTSSEDSTKNGLDEATRTGKMRQVQSMR